MIVKRLGLSEMRIVYAFPIVGPDQIMLLRNDREGPGDINNWHLADAIVDSSLIIAGWGPALGKEHLKYRYLQLKKIFEGKKVHALAVTDAGQPWSPQLVQEPKFLEYHWDALDRPTETGAA